MDDLKILENSRLFAGIRVDEIQPMLSCLQAVERKYPRGAYIFHTGEEVRALALLVRGTAHIQKEDFWGNRSLLASLAAGDIFAEAYAMPGSGAMRSDVVAVESCTVLLMDVERVLSRCTNSCAFHARLTENLFALLAEKNRILARKVDYLAQRTTRQRLLVYLSEAVRSLRSRSTGSSWPIFSRSNGARCPPSFRGCRRRACSRRSGAIFASSKRTRRGCVSSPGFRVLVSLRAGRSAADAADSRDRTATSSRG